VVCRPKNDGPRLLRLALTAAAGQPTIGHKSESPRVTPDDSQERIVSTAFETSNIVSRMIGRFGWSLDPADHTLSLTYTPTPVPEPGTLAFVGLAAAGLACWRRLGQPMSRPSHGSS
jgi:PEP-CTERM motif